MTRDHMRAKASGGDASQEDAQPHGPNRQMAQIRVLREFRQQITDKATKAYPETVMQALLIDRTMIAADQKEMAAHKLDPDLGGRVGETLFDKIREHLVHGLGEAMGLAEHFSGALLGAFEGARALVREQIVARGQVTAIDITDAVLNGAYRAMERYRADIGGVIQQIPAGQLLDAYRRVAAEKGRGAEEEEDVQAVLEEHALERVVGLPQTGGARAHELSKQFYDTIQAEVRATKPVREQVDEIAEMRGSPGLSENKARQAEAGMSEADGSGLSENIRKDEAARSRVAEIAT